MTNKYVKEVVGFIDVFQIYPDMFRLVVAIFRGRRCLRRQLRPPKEGNHLPKHVGVNLEYINKSN
jgi:hypothetical protein